MTQIEGVAVPAQFDKLDGSPKFERDVELYLSNGWLHMRGGPTGFESMSPLGWDGESDWTACDGTPGRWVRCVVPASSLRQALHALPVPR